MHFTYENKEYRLRNKMNSTVKTMGEVAVLYNEDTGDIKEYGNTSEIEKRHRNLAEAGERQYLMFRSDSLNLEVINKVINNEANMLDVIREKTVATKWFVSYYPTGWTPSLISKKSDKPEKKEDVAVGDIVRWNASSSSRQYKIVSEGKDNNGKLFTLEYKGANFTAPESELEKIS